MLNCFKGLVNDLYELLQLWLMEVTRLCARKIKNLREFHNFTQGYVADELEMSQNAYSSLENGNTRITIDRIVSLAKLYNISPSELIQETVNETSVKHIQRNHNSIHSNFPPVLSELEKLMYEQTINRLEANIEKLYDLIAQLTTKIADPQNITHLHHLEEKPEDLV